MADVFISYSHFDRAVVGGMQATLMARGKDVWVDDQQIAPASKWADQLKAAIETADAFVFVISPDSAVSPECRQELAYATSLNKRIIPCVVRATNLAVLPDPLPSHQFVPPRGVFEDNVGASIELLIAAIETDLEWTQEHTRWGRKAIDWEEHGRDRSFLVGGSELRAAEDFVARAPGRRPEPTGSHSAFVLASRKASDRRQRTWRGALGAGLIVALVLAGLALVQRHSADVQRNSAVVQRNHARVATTLAKSRQLAWESEADLSSGPQKSLKLGLSSTILNGTGTSEESLRLALADSPMRAAIATGAGGGALTAWDPLGGQLAVTGPGGTVSVWDPLTLHLLHVLHATSPAAPTTLSYSPDGRWLVSVTPSGSVSMWTASGATVSTTSLDAMIHGDILKGKNVYVRPYGVWLAGESPELVVSGEGLSHIVGFQPAAGRATDMYSTSSGGLMTLVANPASTELFVIYGKIYDVINLKSGKQVEFHVPHPTSFTFVDDNACWTSDGKSVVTWDNEEANDLFLHVWNASTGGQESSTALGTTISAAACGAGPSHWVSAGSGNGEVRLYVGGTTIQLNGHNSTIGDIESSPNGQYLATASADGTARVWSSANGNLVRLLAGDGAPIERVSFSPNNALLATVDNLGVVRLWDAGIGQPLATMASDGPGQPYPLGFGASGTSVYGLQAAWAPVSKDDTPHIQALHAVIWNAASGAVEHSIALPADAIAGKLSCPNNLNELDFCDLTAPANLVTDLPSPSQTNQPVAVAFSADTQLIAYGQPGSITVVGASGQVTGRLSVSGTPTGLSFVGISHQLVVMTAAAVQLWTPGGAARTFKTPSAPIDAEVSSNGQRLAAALVGGTVSVWNTATGATVASLHPTTAGKNSSLNPTITPVPLRVALNANGSLVTLATTFQSVQTWDIATGRLVAARIVQSPGDTAKGGFGASGPWPIAELRPSADGTAMLAVDFPEIATGDVQPPATAQVFDGVSATHGAEATFISQNADLPAINPGAALSPNGTFVLSGVSGLAPAPPGGVEAVYQVVGGQLLADLQSVPADTSASASPADPWSPSGVSVLAGDAVYPCDACGTLAQMQAQAKVRLAWLKPVSVAHPNPPAGDPYG